MNDRFNDHFMEQDEHKEKPVHVETPQEREEREIEESTISRRHNKQRIIIFSSIGAVLLILFFWMWMRYYHPRAHCEQKGWIIEVTNEGSIFKTLECKVITEKLIMDSVKVKWSKDTVIVDGCDLTVSLANDTLAKKAAAWKGTGKRVVISYDEYSGALPWRGATNRIVTDIRLDTVK